jgi:hypothetical protein
MDSPIAGFPSDPQDLPDGNWLFLLKPTGLNYLDFIIDMKKATGVLPSPRLPVLAG